MRARAKNAHKLREREKELRANARYAQKRYRGSRGNARKSKICAQVMRKRRRIARKSQIRAKES
ncbi:hypothetical protein MHI57_16960 [Cytobacillus sp. FSL K6-0129]|uniref:hypothetical protein n=1 Tax=Cytobacillus sp. FSL K6-0129 TaxID=2921421 RepID=UPI0030F7B992